MRLNALRTLTGTEQGSLGREALIGKLFWATFHRGLGELAMDVLGAEATVCGELSAGAVMPGPGAGGPADGRDAARYDPTPAQRLFLFSRADTIYAGSNQIQRTTIGERGLGLPKEPRPDAGAGRTRAPAATAGETDITDEQVEQQAKLFTFLAALNQQVVAYTGTIEQALGAKPGVSRVAVSLTHEQALVEYDGDRTDAKTLMGTLQQIGYTLSDPRKVEPFERQEQALAIERNRLGPGDPGTVATLQALSDTLTRLGELDAAEPLAREALAIRQGANPQDPLAIAESTTLECDVCIVGSGAGGAPATNPGSGAGARVSAARSWSKAAVSVRPRRSSRMQAARAAPTGARRSAGSARRTVRGPSSRTGIPSP